MKDCWAEVQADVIGCNRCATHLRDVEVDCPPGLLYPQGIEPPASIRVLFVGVAPPENGCHFYTDQSDNLRRGLFDTLADLGRPVRTLEGFIAHGFFLVHTAKCTIRRTTKPDLRVSRFCASQHLRREIECLSPDVRRDVGAETTSQMRSARWVGRLLRAGQHARQRHSGPRSRT